MSDSAWKTPYWPEGVVHTFTDYQFPIFKFLDDSAKAYPDSIFTQFNGASRTYAQVKDTADRIANFLSSRGIQKGDKVSRSSCPTCPSSLKSFSEFSRPAPWPSTATRSTPRPNSITS